MRALLTTALAIVCVAGLPAQEAAPPNSPVQRSEGANQQQDRTVRPQPVDGTAPANVPLPPKARKAMQQAIEDLQSGKLNNAQQRLEKALADHSDSADLNYFLGVLYSEKRDLEQAKTYLTQATVLDRAHVPALTLLSKVRLEMGDDAGAIQGLKQAVALHPQDLTAHLLLANAYLRQKEYEKCREEAEAAIQAGKGAGHTAELPLGQALVKLGRVPEGVAALQAFLQHVPASPLAPQVRTMIEALKTPAEGPAPPLAGEPAPLLAPLEAGLWLPSWGPPGIDELRPPVTPGVACSTQRVIEGAGKRVEELMADVARFDATEELVHEVLDEIGTPLSRETRKFGYVVTMAVEDAAPKVHEYRDFSYGQSEYPGGIAAYNLMAPALIFHPALRDNYEWTCEGRGEWQGQPAWVVYFRQRADRPSRLLVYSLEKSLHSVDLKGRVWIAANTLQLMHLETELVRPMPEIKLLVHHQSIDYGGVAFPAKHAELWLPKSTVLYFHFRGYRYRRSNTLKGFRLFSVESSQKDSAPKQ